MEKTIIDSCVYIAIINKDDSLHEMAKNVFEDIGSCEIILPDYVYIEVLNILKRKLASTGCAFFLHFLKYLGVEVSLNNWGDMENAGEHFFNNKKLSFQDCLLLSAAKQENAKLVTFDKALQNAWNKLK